MKGKNKSQSKFDDQKGYNSANQSINKDSFDHRDRGGVKNTMNSSINADDHQ